MLFADCQVLVRQNFDLAPGWAGGGKFAIIRGFPRAQPVLRPVERSYPRE